MANKDVFTFYNGVPIPSIGFGTWQNHKKEAYAAVTMALKNGPLRTLPEILWPAMQTSS